jgi:hypothetical protein
MESRKVLANSPVQSYTFHSVTENGALRCGIDMRCVTAHIYSRKSYLGVVFFMWRLSSYNKRYAPLLAFAVALVFGFNRIARG